MVTGTAELKTKHPMSFKLSYKPTVKNLYVQEQTIKVTILCLHLVQIVNSKFWGFDFYLLSKSVFTPCLSGPSF